MARVPGHAELAAIVDRFAATIAAVERAVRDALAARAR